jgi:3-isopropylmalate/(R)-2-methylmalate dehydratase small subunit
MTTHKEYKASPIPPFMQDLIAAGGLVEWTKQELRAKS